MDNLHLSINMRTIGQSVAGCPIRLNAGDTIQFSINYNQEVSKPIARLEATQACAVSSRWLTINKIQIEVEV